MPVIQEIEDDEDGAGNQDHGEREEREVDLGFLVPFKEDGDEDMYGTSRKTWKIWSTGKIGGRPGWLDNRRLPDIKNLICDHCGEPMMFLAQIYAPLDEYSRAYHRTLYVFSCRRAVCLRKSDGAHGAIRVLRCQLPKENPFFEAPKEEEEEEEDSEASDYEEDDSDENREADSKRQAERRRLADLAEATEREILARVRTMKSSGNEAYTSKNIEQALKIYDDALDVLRDVVEKSPYRLLSSSVEALDLACALRSNRCQALLCLKDEKRLNDALDDANWIAAMKPEWAKAHYRRVKALEACSRSEDAKSARATYRTLAKCADTKEGMKRFEPVREANLECEPEPEEAWLTPKNVTIDGDATDEEDEEDNDMAGTADGTMMTQKEIREALGSKSSTADKQTLAFQRRVKCRPTQCLRYCRWQGNDAMLWPSEERRLDPDFVAPRCSRCGGERQFEMQIMPQMLHLLSLGVEPGSADWETIAIYTCTNSCEGRVLGGYTEEWAWGQTSSKNFLC